MISAKRRNQGNSLGGFFLFLRWKYLSLFFIAYGTKVLDGGGKADDSRQRSNSWKEETEELEPEVRLLAEGCLLMEEIKEAITV